MEGRKWLAVDANGRPSCRDRSAIFPVVLQILHKFAPYHDGFTRRWVTASEQLGAQMHGWPRRSVRLGDPAVAVEFCHHAMIETVIENGVRQFIFSSTCAAYGNPAQVRWPTTPRDSGSLVMVLLRRAS